MALKFKIYVGPFVIHTKIIVGPADMWVPRVILSLSLLPPPSPPFSISPSFSLCVGSGVRIGGGDGLDPELRMAVADGPLDPSNREAMATTPPASSQPPPPLPRALPSPPSTLPRSPYPSPAPPPPAAAAASPSRLQVQGRKSGGEQEGARAGAAGGVHDGGGRRRGGREGGGGEKSPETVAAELKEAETAAISSGWWVGVAQEMSKIEWPVPGKVVGTTGVVLGVIAGSTAALLSVNALLAELSDRTAARAPTCRRLMSRGEREK
ncbi:hypothetical protein EE612_044122 [Oryza sativa]|nr:hypothetical protein EE612_044122 [Oryza sativa]